MTIMSNRGVWLLHMLRFMMYDLEQKSEKKFQRFLHELSIFCNGKQYTNSDIQALAEKHYGEPLDWFFDQWLYQYGIPEFEVEYKIHNRKGGYSVTGDVKVKDVDPDFKMPVVLRVVTEDGQSTFYRHMISGTEDSFDLGMIDGKPKELIFNEFYSVLSRDKVKKK